MQNHFSSARKAARYEQRFQDTIVSPRTYNLLIGGITAYGLIINYIICKYFSHIFTQMNPILLYGGYIVCVIAGCIIVNVSHKPLISFLGYNLVVLPLGAVLSVALSGYDTRIIFQACGLTGSVTVIMLCLSALFPNFFLRIGRVLFFSLFAVLLVGMFGIFLGIPLSFYSWLSAGIFSLYIGFDWARANRYPHTLDNAVDAACDLYIDIVNLFMDILAIISDN